MQLIVTCYKYISLGKKFSTIIGAWGLLNGALVMALNWARITHGSYRHVSLSSYMEKPFLKVLNKLVLSWQKILFDCTAKIIMQQI